MARTGRPKAPLTVSAAEQAKLLRGMRAATSTQAYALRCRIVLACAEQGAVNSRVAAELGVSVPTVAKWRSRFIEHGLAGLSDKPRPGRPPSVPPEKIEEVVTLTLEQSPPRNATHWSRAAMAERTGLSKSTIGRIWRRFDLRPHMVEGFEPSATPLFAGKAANVVGLYHNPPERAVALYVDKEPQIRGSQPVPPTILKRCTHDRHQTTSLLATFDIGARHRERRAIELKKFLVRIDMAVPSELHVHLVCDNIAMSRSPIINEWLVRHPRFHVHVPPTGSSWINQVERWFSHLTDRGAHRNVQALERDVRDWIAQWNADPRPLV